MTPFECCVDRITRWSASGGGERELWALLPMLRAWATLIKDPVQRAALLATLARVTGAGAKQLGFPPMVTRDRR